MTHLTHDEWEAKFLETLNALKMQQGKSHQWAFERAHEIMKKAYGPQPPEVKAPGLVAWMKLGLQLKGFRMHNTVNAWLTAAGAAFTTAAAQYALANADQIITGGEWAGIAIQFISVLLGTLAKFNQPAPKE